MKRQDFVDYLPYLNAIRQTVDRKDPATLWRALDMYLNLCCNKGMLISNKSLYFALGLSKATIHAWAHGLRKQHQPEYARFAALVKEVCAAAREQYGVEGQVDPILTIWHQKFYDGFTDNPPSETVHSPLGDLPDADAIEEYSRRLADG